LWNQLEEGWNILGHRTFQVDDDGLKKPLNIERIVSISGLVPKGLNKPQVGEFHPFLEISLRGFWTMGGWTSFGWGQLVCAPFQRIVGSTKPWGKG